MRRWIWVIACLLIASGLAAAQDPPSPSAAETPRAAPAAKPVPEPPSPPAARPIREVEPPLYYLKDKDGNLQAVPGFGFEEFVEFYKLKHQLAELQHKPRSSLQRMTVTGTVTGQRAELSVRFKVLTDDNAWVRVPLRLEQAVLAEPVQYTGPGEQFTHFEENGEGYVSWIRSRSGEQHELTLKLLVSLTTAGDGTRLKLFLPRATTSELKLTVPVADISARVSEGATLSAPAAAGAGKTELSVQGLGGDFELTWRAADAHAAEVRTVLEAVGKILARIDSRTIDSEATLTVRSYGDPFDRFRVRLPLGAELLAGTPSGYTVTPIEEKGKASDKRMVEVRLAKRTTGPVDIQLTTRRSHEIGKQSDWLELSGFEVVEAARQWGHIAVAIVGDWHVLWGPSRGVRQVDQWPESLRYKDVLAGYEYFAHPCSLTARLVARKTHVNAEPEYLLMIDPEQVRLEAKLKYTIRGAKTFGLEVRLGDWVYDEVEPEHVVAVDGVTVNPAQTLSIPLQQPSTGQVELVVRAHRPITPGTKALSLPLPQPVAYSLGPASLVVLPADNVELTPDGQAMAGLSRQQVPPQTQLPARQQDPLFYRGDAAKAVFAAGFRIHARSVSVDVRTQVNLDVRTAQVEQRLAYKITYEPIDRLTIEVPRGLVSLEGFAVQWQGQPIVPVVATASETPGPAASTVRMWAVLPAPHIGAGELTLRYPVKVPELSVGTPTPLRLPLVMPVDGKMLGNKLTVTAAAQVVVQQQPGPWTVAEDEIPKTGRQRTLAIVSPQPAAEVPLSARLEDQSQGGSTVIERALVQTWLSSVARQDRCVFRFTSSEKEVVLVLPEGAAFGQTLLLDGKQVAPTEEVGNRLTVSLAGDGTPHQHLIELKYHYPDGRPPRGAMVIGLPELGQNAWIRRIYWQLILPRNEHVIVPPVQFTREFTWGWNDYFWGRRSLLEQAPLETWIGASPQSPIPEGTNRYLFSGMGQIGRGDLYTTSRAWIVLLASGAALVVGLALIYVPATRHPAALFAVIVALLSVGALYPEPTVLMAQAASVGIVLTLVAALLRRALARPRAVVRREPSQVIIDRGSTQPYHQIPSVGNQTSMDNVSASASPSATMDWNV